MAFRSELSYYQEKINTELNIFFSKKLRQVNNIDSSTTDMIKKAREFNLRGGKRVRPILVVMGYKLLKNKSPEKVIKPALAVELMESFLLIHDDIIDNDSLRRGKPTLHKIYEIDKKENDEDYGKNMALLAGDLLAIFGSETILNSDFNHKIKARAVEKFNNIIANTIFGQTLDYLGNFSQEFAEDYIKRVHILKTAKYTIEGPLHIGAILAGAKEKHLKQISGFSIPLGQAFQIKDDILNIFGEESEIGKSVCSDIKEGKKTLLIAKALENSTLKQRLFIKRCLGNKNLTKKQIKKLKKIIIDTGSLDYSKQIAQDMVKRAKIKIKSSKFKKPAKIFLLNLADYIIERDK
ncbi:polyprenyl synthetase family protein [Candidatus Woesearchaeota archaeon]|nr:polyprenyl synthetase family protein [Candidatus Woesearchaeota archaeon]